METVEYLGLVGIRRDGKIFIKPEDLEAWFKTQDGGAPWCRWAAGLKADYGADRPRTWIDGTPTYLESV